MSDLKVNLTPYTYCNITQIHKLFSAEEASADVNQEVAKNPLSLNKLKHKASIQGTVSKQEHPLSPPESFYTFLHKEMLLFYAHQSNSNGNDEMANNDHLDPSDKVNQAMDNLFRERGYLIIEGVNDRAPAQTFSLRGCSIMSSTEDTLKLANGQVQTCELIFKTHK